MIITLPKEAKRQALFDDYLVKLHRLIDSSNELAKALLQAGMPSTADQYFAERDLLMERLRALHKSRQAPNTPVKRVM